MTFAMLCFNYTVGIPCAATVLTWLFVLWRGRFFTAQAKQPHPPNERENLPTVDRRTHPPKRARTPANDWQAPSPRAGAIADS